MRNKVIFIHQATDWTGLGELAAWVVNEALQIQSIPAPTFDEARRAQYVKRRFQELGLDSVTVDPVNNVYGRLDGKSSATALMVLAHTDTVFPADTDLAIQRAGDRLVGPGIGDNSLGVAALLGLAKWLSDEHARPACDIWFVADSCEEGLGDLKGAKAAFDRLGSQISAVINIEGLALGHIYNAGTAVHRLRIHASAAGGHSWLNYGRPSAIHGILNMGNRILEIEAPRHPRTTMNIGLIDGGHAINAIATEASIWLDLRSTSPEVVRELRAKVSSLVEQSQSEGMRFAIETVGERPAGSISSDHVLVRGAMAALKTVGIRGSLETGSTDGNVPLAKGCPTVTIGITRGGNAHRLDEFIEIPPVRSGLQQLITLVAAAAEHYAETGAWQSG